MAIISFIINSELSLEFAKKIKQNNDFEIHGLAVDNSLDSKLKDFFPEAGKAKILKGFDAHNIPLYKILNIQD